MKCLYYHAKNFRTEAGVAKGRPSKFRKDERKLRRKLGDTLPELDETNRITSSENALLAFICVEIGDEKISLEEVAYDIINAKALLGVAEIVICAFAHLSHNIAPPEIARKVVDNIYDTVRYKHAATKNVPFGWDKSFEITVPSHHYNVAFRSFTPAVNMLI